MRHLIYIPIVHSQADMGGMADAIRAVTIRKLGVESWEGSVRAVDALWEEIRREIEGWDLAYEKIRLYQDGLPICGREVEIVAELTRSGSANHRLLSDLMEKGATLMGTESPELLLKEYALVREVLAARDPRAAERIAARQKADSRALLNARDDFIAHRINDTLQDAETGILFLGLLHAVQGRLAADIEVRYPIQIGATQKRRRSP